MRIMTVAATLAVSVLSTSTYAQVVRTVPPQCKVEVTCPPNAPPPKVVPKEAPPRAAVPKSNMICRTGCLTDHEWENCPTKRWWASGSSGARTQYFFAKCGTVCKPAGHEAMWYNTSTKRQVVFRF